MADSVVEVVEKLQSRLSLAQEPKKLLKTLKRLADLPITVDILVETGIGKTVNSLRKHSVVGEYAKTLVAKWKKLVPQEGERPNNDSEVQEQQGYEKASSRKRQRDPSPEKEVVEEEDEEEAVNYRENYQLSHSQSHSQNYGHANKKPKKSSESEKLYKSSSYAERFSSRIEEEEEEEEEEEQWSRPSQMEEYEEHESDDGGWHTPQHPPPTSHRVHKDHLSNNEKSDKGRERQGNSSCEKVDRSYGSQQKTEKNREKDYSGVSEKVDTGRVKEHKSLHKEKHQHHDRSKHLNSEGQERTAKSSDKERHQHHDSKAEEKNKHPNSDFQERTAKSLLKDLHGHKERELVSSGGSGKEKQRSTESLELGIKKDKTREGGSSSKDKLRALQEENSEQSGGFIKDKSRSRLEEGSEQSGGYSKDKSRPRQEEALEQSGGYSKDKSRLRLEESSEQIVKKHKHRESEKTKSDASDKAKIHNEKQKFDREKQKTHEKPKEKTKDTDEPGAKSKSSESSVHKGKSSSGVAKESGDTELEDVFERPTMSFESYLSYDLPQKKKKKVSKPVGATADRGKETSKQNGSSSGSRTSSQKEHTTNEKKEEKTKEKKKVKESKKESSSGTPKKMLIDVVPTLPDIPLPPIQPNYRPLPSIDTMPLSPQKKRVVFSVPDEEAALFTGRRLNSKMQVYSGSKITYLPKMMSLFEQCIRVLQNNVDSIHEVGGVPYEILEPVLERCTPEQLYHIEECNPVFVEDTEELWRKHCIRDFKNEEPQEFETWREMYLRRHEERERRLQLLTKNISTAHANKPKGRQVKLAFVNTEVKPPRDVRRRQEKYGTGAAAVPEKHRIKPFVSTGMSSSSSSANTSHGTSTSTSTSSSSTIGSISHSGDSSSYDGPSTSGGYSNASASATSPSGQDPRKPAVKKIAPMMAKTIKAFKNRFFRR